MLPRPALLAPLLIPAGMINFRRHSLAPLYPVKSLRKVQSCSLPFPHQPHTAVCLLSMAPLLFTWSLLLASWAMHISAFSLGLRSTSAHSNVKTVFTSLGLASGVADANGVTRYTVRYAEAQRWSASHVATSWQLPNGATDPSALPLMCPQPGADDSEFSEDCLSLILYVPPNLEWYSEVPTFMWIHGGSFIVGSATDPGLDGSALAAATKSIVAVVQYRLGAFGFLSPFGQTNLAVRDVFSALQFLWDVLPFFGGSPERITIAGQSSGADMVRALLATPSASPLFQSAIIQSAPLDYGMLSPTDQNTLQNYFNSLLSCASHDTSCLQKLSVDDIIVAEEILFSSAYTVVPATGQFEPMRPVKDGWFITNPLDLTTPFPPQYKPVIVTTVLDEGALQIYGTYTSALPEDQFQPIVNQTFGPKRTPAIVDSTHYTVPTGDANVVDARVQLNTLGTDYIFRCSSWSFAREWANAGGQAYVGHFIVGATYPGNEDVPFCTDPGSVCHQDDIEIVFGTVPSPSVAQAALVREMQARYASFLHSGSPNPGQNYATWTSIGSSGEISAVQLGGNGITADGACATSFWGESAPYDYQVYGI